MSLYLYQNDKQSGPFSDEEVRQKLQQGIVLPETLAWREGMGDWVTLASLLQLSAPPRPPVVQGGKPILGIISLSYGCVSALGWFILFVVAGIAASHGKPSQEFNIIVGLFAMGGLAFNIVAMVLGIIGAIQNRGRALSIGGACLNVCLLLGVLALVGIGMAAKHAS